MLRPNEGIIMANLTGEERATYVQNMFTRIAGRYDVMNRLMTFGQDMRWRKIVLQKAQVAPGKRILDLGAGTGDMYIQTVVETPVNLTKRQKELLREFSEAETDEKTNPESAKFFSKVRELWDDFTE